MLSGQHDSSWAGPYDVTPDWQPVLDEWPDITGLYIAAGFSGHGFKFFPAVGRMMASLIYEGKKPIGMGIFYAKRFEEGKLIKDTSWSWAYITPGESVTNSETKTPR
jgi:glycine/D-amino acid oxidase-like deaminating enzyme